MMLARIYAIALNTFREAVRSKVLYAILFFAIFLIMLSMAFGELSLYEQERVIKDLGIVVITALFLLVGMAVFGIEPGVVPEWALTTT